MSLKTLKSFCLGAVVKVVLSHWRSPPKLQQLCQEPLPVVSQLRACWKQSPLFRQKVSFWQNYHWNARNAARNVCQRSDTYFGPGYCVPKLHPLFWGFLLSSIFAWTYGLAMLCEIRVTLQSHRCQLGVESERSRGLGMQKGPWGHVLEPATAFCKQSGYTDGTAKKVGWFDMTKKLLQGKKQLLILQKPGISLLFICGQLRRMYWQMYANETLRKWDTIVKTSSNSPPFDGQESVCVS